MSVYFENNSYKIFFFPSLFALPVKDRTEGIVVCMGLSVTSCCIMLSSNCSWRFELLIYWWGFNFSVKTCVHDLIGVINNSLAG